MQVRFGLISPDQILWSEEDLNALGDGLGAMLKDWAPLYGQLSFEDEKQDENTSFTDDFHMMMTAFCIQAIPVLASGDPFETSLAAYDDEVRMTPSEGQVEIAGDSIPELTVNKAELLQELAACAARYITICQADPNFDDTRLTTLKGAFDRVKPPA